MTGDTMGLNDFSSLSPLAGTGTSRPFVKMHGLRNHFVIFDRRVDRRGFQTDDIVRICDTHVGVGGDQLLTIEPPSRAGHAEAAMRIFNIDGREVSACGNATRCVAHLLFEESGKTELLLETTGGILKCRRAGPMQISVGMGPISRDWHAFPMAREVDTLHLPIANGPLADAVAIWIGNPHVVFFVENIDAVNLPEFAPAIQNDPLFPEGVNVGMAQLVDDETIRLVVWERPGLLTEACGTGACVAAFAARLRGLSNSSRFTVHLPAGPLTIEISGDRAVMTGPVAYCCRGFVDCDDNPNGAV